MYTEQGADWLNMKILSIGNSFSQDAHKWLSQIALSCGDEIQSVNLYIGGCALEAHWHNYLTQTPAYDLELNGEFINKVSVTDALREEYWDVITLHQASRFCGDYSTYQPYLTELVSEAKKICPDARYYMHQTWSYEKDSQYPPFANYGYSQVKMYCQLKAAYGQAADSIGAKQIPVGDAIHYLRDNLSEFDYKNGGLSLNWDGFHLSWLYGRYAAALTWYGVLTGKDVRSVSFSPCTDRETAEEGLLRKINDAIYIVLPQEK